MPPEKKHIYTKRNEYFLELPDLEQILREFKAYEVVPQKEVEKLSGIIITYDAQRKFFEQSFEQEIKVWNGNISQLLSAKLVIIPGGGDVHPRHYGKNITYSRDVSNARDELEFNAIKLIQSSFKNKLHPKLLCICRGSQVYGVASGGFLYQDLYMDGSVTHPMNHPIEIIRESRFARIFKDSGVNSYHHQGVPYPMHSPNYQNNSYVTAIYRGVVEFVEKEHVLAVQSHPEFLNTKESKEFFNEVKKWSNL